MSSQKARLAVILCSLVSLFSPFLHGQATGSFSGTITDKAGAVISGATVKLTSQGTGVSREAQTDDSGHFLVPVLASRRSIRSESRPKVLDPPSKGRPAAGRRAPRAEFHPPACFGQLPPLRLTRPKSLCRQRIRRLGQVITSDQVAELPLNGRDFVQLATLTTRNNSGNQSRQLLQRWPEQRSLGSRDVFAFCRRVASAEH